MKTKLITLLFLVLFTTNIVLAQQSNCFETGHGYGCDMPACEASVCSYDSFCCNVNWDSICVNEALNDPACTDPQDGDIPEFTVVGAIAVLGLAGLYIYKKR